MLQTLKNECDRLGVRLDVAQLDALCRYGEALLEKNRVMNLTAITDPREVARLHFADCLALTTLFDFSGKTAVDVGCGAGFPGVPLQIAVPSMKLTLLDSLQKRMTWLGETVRALGLPSEVVCCRAEEFDRRERYDVAVSRAVARLNVLCELCLPLVRVGGSFLAMKASAAEEELDEARRAVAVLGGRVRTVASYELGDLTRRVVVIDKLRPTPAAYPRRFAKIKQKPL